jgi:hypothetical protein
MLCNYCSDALCTFACLDVFHFIFSFFLRAYMWLPPLSGFWARLLFSSSLELHLLPLITIVLARASVYI